MVTAMNSGVTAPPPEIFNSPRSGMSIAPGMPPTSQPSTVPATSMPIAGHSTGHCAPEASNARRARRTCHHEATMPHANPDNVAMCPVLHSGIGNDKPFLLRKKPGKGFSAPDISGSQSVRTKYHIRSCSSTGTLRNSST